MQRPYVTRYELRDPDGDGQRLAVYFHVSDDYDSSNPAHNELVWNEFDVFVQRLNASRPAWDEISTKDGYLNGRVASCQPDEVLATKSVK